MRSMLPAALALIAGSAHAGTLYDLATPGAQLTALSQNGRIASLYGVDTGWRWAKDIGVTEVGNFAEAFGANSWGQALAGGTTDADGNQVAALAYSNSDLLDGPIVIGPWPGGIASDGFLSRAFGVSDNGVAVGLAIDDTGKYFAFRWSAAEGMSKLPVNRPQRSSRANKTSADGSVIVGWNDQESGFRSGVIWKDGAAIDLADSDGVPSGEAIAVSRDGRVVVGERAFNTTTFKYEGWRWTEETGVQRIGCLQGPFGCDPFSPRAVSDDGSVIVGDAVVGGSYVAAVWTQKGGVQNLADYLAAQGLAPDGWALRSGGAISGDGKTIGGWGVNPNNVFTSYVADLHEAPPTEAIVEVHGTVNWNDLPEGPFAGIAVDTPVTMSFRVTTVDAAEIDPGMHTAYIIELDTFRLDADGASDTLVPATFGPALRIANDYPLSDGIHLFETPMATAGQMMELELFGTSEGPLAGGMFDSDDLDRINRTFGPEFFNKTSWVITQQGGSFGMYMSLQSISINDYVPGDDDTIFADGFESR
ncbi:hypothetical protein [Dokdonella sp.]|uniref:hypothetical protein n=1 Tax=Dokdonella sp. TaxID=2291710 RepID=UPI001B257E88|nr:hypothetical protein [Dokdonella sp.]MBO9662685.1 hypothetical protein [Dokdonella sp.]